MPQFNLQQFTADKATSVIYESIAEFKIAEFYASQGKRINGCLPNPAGELDQKRLFDLTDSLGVRWEVKTDRKSSGTGRCFIEHQALSHSESDYYLILAFGLAHVVPTPALRHALIGTETVQGGDRLSTTGALLTQQELQQLSIAII